jgi:hypothetical protein
MLYLYATILKGGHLCPLFERPSKTGKNICIQQNLYLCVTEIGCKHLLSDFKQYKAYIKKNLLSKLKMLNLYVKIGRGDIFVPFLKGPVKH